MSYQAQLWSANRLSDEFKPDRRTPPSVSSKFCPLRTDGGSFWRLADPAGDCPPRLDDRGAAVLGEPADELREVALAADEAGAGQREVVGGNRVGRGRTAARERLATERDAVAALGRLFPATIDYAQPWPWRRHEPSDTA